MKAKQRYKLAAAMRFIYGHFLEEDETLADFMGSRKVPRPNIRHIVRWKLYVHTGYPYRVLCEVEAELNGGMIPDHSTISHSVKQAVVHYNQYKKAGKMVDQLLLEFENYWMELAEPDITDRIRHYYALPHHVLAAIVGLAAGLGWADSGKLEDLEREFGTVSREFVEKQVASNE